MATGENLALTGTRVLELADEKGAYCGKLLADMGADVIKIERPGGDPTRNIPPFRHDKPHPHESLFFLYMNTSKRGVTLDITREEGQATFKRLAKTADLIVETFAPGYMDSLGLGYPTLREANPGLVLTSITGFGQTGPYRNFKPADIVASALGGAMYVTGEVEDPPVALAGFQAYVTASTCAAVSSLIALYHSLMTGEGQCVDISVEEAMVATTHICGVPRWLDDGMIPNRLNTGLRTVAPGGAYPCKDGLAYLIVDRPLHWKALAAWISEVTGNREVLDPIFEGATSKRLPYRDLLDVYVSDFTSRFTVDEVCREGQKRHLAFNPVNTAGMVTDDIQLNARGYWVDIEHDGGVEVRYPGAPYRCAETSHRIRRTAPHVGEHNDEVYRQELGFTEEAIALLREASAI